MCHSRPAIGCASWAAKMCSPRPATGCASQAAKHVSSETRHRLRQPGSLKRGFASLPDVIQSFIKPVGTELHPAAPGNIARIGPSFAQKSIEPPLTAWLCRPPCKQKPFISLDDAGTCMNFVFLWNTGGTRKACRKAPSPIFDYFLHDALCFV